MSINRITEWVCVYSGIPFSAKGGQISETCSNLDDLKDIMLKEARYKRVPIAWWHVCEILNIIELIYSTKTRWLSAVGDGDE